MKKQGMASITDFTVLEQVTHDEMSESAVSQQERINWAQSIWGVPTAWRETLGAGVKVAILDTGIDEDHPDLRDAIVDAKDFTRSGIQDANGHGTHCAGIVGARANGVGFIGIAPQCELLIGKVLGDSGSGSLRQVADGIDWAVEAGADIISLSLGAPVSSMDLYESVHFALGAGVSIICAAGNSGSYLPNNINFPAIFGSTITVGAHDHQGNPTGFSSRGGEIDVLAPGKSIWSTYTGHSYAALDGTSMATPMVAGLGALIISKHLHTQGNETPIENCEDLRQHILRMAAHNGYHSNERGYGPLMPLRYFS